MSRHTVTSRTPMFRRAGITFTRTPTLVDSDELGAARMAAILHEPNLVVQPVVDESAPPPKGKK